MSYQTFVFEKYEFDEASGVLRLHYGYDDTLHFCEVLKFNFPFVDYNSEALDRALQLLFFVAGISYYKAYLAPSVRIDMGRIDRQTLHFLKRTYQKGLGEFFYVNGLDPNYDIPITQNSDSEQSTVANPSVGMLVGIGGGKDSLLSCSMLRDANIAFDTWSLDHQVQLSPLVNRIGTKHFWVEREWDSTLLELNEKGALNGHVPISAIIACVGVIVAILSGHRDVVVSNEQSANEPTLVYQGVEINHQYSKSQEFETDFQNILGHLFGDSIRYYSLLRPIGELRIAELFSSKCFDTYYDVFSSCNYAYTHSSTGLFWDGTCPKCAFTFLVLCPFVPLDKLQHLFGGKNLLLDPSLSDTYRKLLGTYGEKPLDCVGGIRESRQAMGMAKHIIPELVNKYTYELDLDYDFRKTYTHNIPHDIWTIIEPVFVHKV